MICEPVLECTFLIPLRRDANLSDGQLHNSELWQWLDLELFDRFEGRTMAPGTYKGFYADPDTDERIDDESWKYIVAISESRIDDLRSLLAGACVLFEQKCIYLSVAGHVEFVQRAEPT